jgi:hypothetical protein
MPRGYMEGPASEAAEARIEALERGEPVDADLGTASRTAVYGCTEDGPARHFLGWADEVDADDLFASGEAWGITLVRRAAAAPLR